MSTANAGVSLKTAWEKLERINENILKDTSKAILLGSRGVLILICYLWAWKEIIICKLENKNHVILLQSLKAWAFSSWQTQAFPLLALSPPERRLGFVEFAFSWWRIIWGSELGVNSRRKGGSQSEGLRKRRSQGRICGQLPLPPAPQFSFLER